MDLNGRAVLITGGRRIGQVVAHQLALRGCDIAVSYAQSRDAADATVQTVRQCGRRGVSVQADLREPEACSSLVNTAADAFGRLDILIHMASVYERRAFDAQTVDEWDRVLSVDLRASWLCARAAVPHMRARGGGRIVNFSDWVAASRRPRYEGYLPYYVAKSGVIALTEALALELAPDRILVNAVAPGPIVPSPETSLAERDAVVRATPLGRWGGEHEIATAVIALVETDFITGETIRVDGGRHLR